MKTHISIVLDASGSMMGKERGVISALNEFVEEQQKVKGKANITIYQFNSRVRKIIDSQSLKKWKPFCIRDYQCDGMTALNDAIGFAMKDILEKEGKRILMVQTDGYENASKEFNGDTIEKYIKDNEKDVEVIFIGAGIDTQQGLDRGVMAHKSMSVPNTAGGQSLAYRSFSASVTEYRMGSVSEMSVSGDSEDDR